MSQTISEKDWKYLRSIKDDLLDALCLKINEKAVKIVRAENMSDYDKYLALFKHVNDSDKLVADCFDDWRRSNLWFKLPLLQRHKILNDEHLANLSAESRELIFRVAAVKG